MQGQERQERCQDSAQHRTSRIRQPGQHIKKITARKGQLEQDSQNEIDRKKTVMIGLPGQDGQDRTVGTGRPG
jgi:hypothetical protein